MTSAAQWYIEEIEVEIEMEIEGDRQPCMHAYECMHRAYECHACCVHHACMHTCMHVHRYIENVLEEVDSPDEWYHDLTAGICMMYVCMYVRVVP